MVWEPEVEELERRRELAKQMGGPERVERQHADGKLTIRERLDTLLDSESLQEIGSLAGIAEYKDGKLESIKPSGYVVGLAKIDGRPVAVGGEDFTSHRTPSFRKQTFHENLADEYRIPLVQLTEGFGGGAEFRTGVGQAPGGGQNGAAAPYSSFIPLMHRLYVLTNLLGKVPVVVATLGSVAGGPAARAPISHFTVMVQGTQIFPGGPPLAKRSLGEDVTKDELGGYLVHARGSGVADNDATDEQDAFDQIRRFLSYLPTNVWQMPPRGDTDDPPDRRDEELLSIVPRDRMRPFNVRKLISHVFDRDSMFETNRYFGRPVVTCFARLHGYPVGVIANDPNHKAGAIDSAAADKMTKFIDTCDTFHVPIVHIMDNPGFMIGTQAEREGTIRHAARWLAAIDQSSVPWLPVVVRKIYGVAGSLPSPSWSINLRYAWPSAEWGGIPVEGGVAAVFRREIEAAENPLARQREIEQQLNVARSPFRTAEKFEIEDVIDPRETRALLCRWIELVQPRLQADLGPRGPKAMRP